MKVLVDGEIVIPPKSHSKIPVLNPFAEEGFSAIEGHFGFVTPRRSLTTCMVAYGVAVNPTWIQVANPGDKPLVRRNRSHICYFHCREEWETTEAFIDPTRESTDGVTTPNATTSTSSGERDQPAVHDEPGSTRSHSVQDKSNSKAVHEEPGSSRSLSVQAKAVHDEPGHTRSHSVQGKRESKAFVDSSIASIESVTTPIIESDRMDNANGTRQSDQLFTMFKKHSEQGVHGATMMRASNCTPLGDLSIRTTTCCASACTPLEMLFLPNPGNALEGDPNATTSTASGIREQPAVHEEPGYTRSLSVQDKRNVHEEPGYTRTLSVQEKAVHDGTTRSHSVQGKGNATSSDQCEKPLHLQYECAFIHERVKTMRLLCAGAHTRRKRGFRREKFVFGGFAVTDTFRD